MYPGRLNTSSGIKTPGPRLRVFCKTPEGQKLTKRRVQSSGQPMVNYKKTAFMALKTTGIKPANFSRPCLDLSIFRLKTGQDYGSVRLIKTTHKPAFSPCATVSLP